MNSDTLSKQIYERMRDKSSEELLTIWKENDRGLWSDEAFKAIEEILSSRKMPLPAQGQIKKSIPQSQLLEECWEKPFLSWAFYVIFLLWIVVFHPFFFVAGIFTLSIQSPLHPDLGQSLTSIGQFQDIHAYVFLGLLQIVWVNWGESFPERLAGDEGGGVFYRGKSGQAFLRLHPDHPSPL